MQDVSKELLDLLMEQEEDLMLAETLQQDDPTAFFRPNPKQRIVCDSDKKEIWIFGGNRAGKTEINLYEFKRQIEGTHPTRSLKPRWDGGVWLWWMCSQDGDTQRDVLQKKWDRMIPKAWIVHQPKIQGKYTHSILEVPNKLYGVVRVEVTWKTYDSKDEAFEGASVDGCTCDEEPPKTKHTGIQARLFDAGAWGNGYFQCAMTPVKGEGWTVTEIIEPYQDGKKPNILMIEMSTYDNAENLGGISRVKAFEEGFALADRPARIYGKGLAREGYVFDKFKNELYPNGHILLPFRPDWTRMMPVESIDYGYSAAMAVLFGAINLKNQIFIYDEIYLKNRTVASIKGLIHLKRRAYGYKTPYITYVDPNTSRTESNESKIIHQFTTKERNVWIGQGVDPAENHIRHLRTKLMDGKIDQDYYGREVAKYYAREGYISFPMSVCPAVNKRTIGWDIANEYLEFDNRTNEPNVFITQNCVNLRREMVRLKWKKQKSGEASVKNEVSGDDHAADAFRYLTFHRLKYTPAWYKRIQGGNKVLIKK